MTEQKDHFTLLKAMNIIRKKINFELIIIGYGINEISIREKINELKLNKFVKLIGYRSNPYPYLRLSDIMILSSRYEGLPNVLLEAQTLKICHFFRLSNWFKRN